MPISVRLKPELERLLDQACKRTRKNRSELIQEALAEYLKQRHRGLGDVIRNALEESPGGFAIERGQPGATEKRDWRR